MLLFRKIRPAKLKFDFVIFYEKIVLNKVVELKLGTSNEIGTDDCLCKHNFLQYFILQVRVLLFGDTKVTRVSKISMLPELLNMVGRVFIQVGVHFGICPLILISVFVLPS